MQMTEKLTLNAAHARADMEAKIKEVHRTLRHFMVTYHDQMATVNASLSDIATALEEHKRQIDRRPVDMEQMKLVLYENVERQVSRALDDKCQDLDRSLSNFFYDADVRIVPKNLMIHSDANTKVKLDEGEE